MRLVRLLRLLGVATACVAVAACGDGAQPRLGDTCSAEARPGLIVEPRDAASGANVAPGSTIIVREGSRVVDSGVGPADSPVLAVLYERPGMYSVTVRTPGYRVWTAENVEVRRDECHVLTVRLAPQLERE